ncbi:MAG TPA: hypothetical protein VJM31_09655 [Vicinamibacterales bacterium]|nr:hypothetical protein [Vicinamibacterales bacterium]
MRTRYLLLSLVAVTLIMGGVVVLRAQGGNIFPSSGNVGIGTTTPAGTLDVRGGVAASGSGSPIILSVQGGGPGGNGGNLLFNAGPNGSGAANGHIAFGTGSSFTGTALTTERMRISSEGRVGIGTTAPAGALDVRGGVAEAGSGAPIILAAQGGAASGNGGNLIFNSGANGSGAANGYIAFGTGSSFTGSGLTTERLRIDADGNVGVGTSAPTSKLHVAGDIKVDGNIAAKYQDVAEWVTAREPAAAGTVMVISPDDRNVVHRSHAKYDTGVAGVVSPQPGITLGEKGDGKVLVAQSGRVLVKVDATYGEIRAGDLLVTSPTPGYAMRSQPLTVDGSPFHRPGTILGKALEPMTHGKGEILILLTLQ